MKFKYLLKGIVKSIPGIEYIYNFHRKTGGTNNARYCYSVWLRHLMMAHENGINSLPVKIAELGPGDSLGIGLAALISGAEKYYALDIVRYSNVACNLKIFDELVTLFKNRTPIPLEAEFPNIRPALTNYDFPKQIFTEEYLKIILDENRLQKIRNSIKAMDVPDDSGKERMLYYRVPWNDVRVIERESVDMIISQAVLQHIDDLEVTYQAMNEWLKKEGLISHSIDLKSMGSSDSWDGHWSYSDMEWRLVKGRKNYLINREPYSTHIKYLHDHGFKILCDKKSRAVSTMKNEAQLAKKFKTMSGEDRTISGTFIQAIKQYFVSLSLVVEEFGNFIPAF